MRYVEHFNGPEHYKCIESNSGEMRVEYDYNDFHIKTTDLEKAKIKRDEWLRIKDIHILKMETISMQYANFLKIFISIPQDSIIAYCHRWDMLLDDVLSNQSLDSSCFEYVSLQKEKDYYIIIAEDLR